jgi:hypothetical protein
MVEGLVFEISFILLTTPPASATLHFTAIHSPVLLFFFSTPSFSFLKLVPFSELARHCCGKVMGFGITDEALDLGHSPSDLV